MVGIYKITNPIGKIYIGQSIELHIRKRHYKKGHCKGQPRIIRSINKYGWENHTFEVIENCEVKLLNERERYWQEYYNVTGEMGLNCLLTGTSSLPVVFTQEVLEKKSKSMKKNFIKTGRRPANNVHSDELVHQICKDMELGLTNKHILVKYARVKINFLYCIRHKSSFKNISDLYNIKKADHCGNVDVFCIEDKLTFKSVQECSIYYGIHIYTIYMSFKKNRKSKKINKSFIIKEKI